MFKRARWIGVGCGLGGGTSVVAVRKARRHLARYRPDALVERVTDGLAHLRDELAAAVDDGRDAARAREADLRARAPISRAGRSEAGTTL